MATCPGDARRTPVARRASGRGGGHLRRTARIADCRGRVGAGIRIYSPAIIEKFYVVSPAVPNGAGDQVWKRFR